MLTLTGEHFYLVA